MTLYIKIRLMFSTCTHYVGRLCTLALMRPTESYFLSLLPHFLSPHHCPLTLDQRVQKKASVGAAPFTDCSTWSGEDNGPVLVQPRARALGDSIQCDELLVLWTVERESPLHLFPSPVQQRGKVVGGGMGTAGLCFLCHTLWLADRGPLWHDPKDLMGDNKASW